MGEATFDFDLGFDFTRLLGTASFNFTRRGMGSCQGGQVGRIKRRKVILLGIRLELGQLADSSPVVGKTSSSDTSPHPMHQ